MRELLLRADTRLVTLTGTGGSGKTRLALEVGRELVEKFPNGVTFVALGGINDASLVVPSVGEALGVEASSSRSLEEALHDHLRERRMLLILDNFEHVLGAAPHARAPLADAPGVTVLVTSRERAAPLERARADRAAAQPDRRGRALHGAREGGAADLRGQRARPPGDRADLPAARRPPARDRARGRAREAALAAGAPGPARATAAAPHRRRARPARAPADACGRRSTGATSCSSRASSGCSPGSPSSRTAARSRPRRRSARRRSTTSHRSSTRACSAGTTTATSSASSCSRRSASTRSSGCASSARSTRCAAGTPSTTSPSPSWRATSCAAPARRRWLASLDQEHPNLRAAAEYVRRAGDKEVELRFVVGAVVLLDRPRPPDRGAWRPSTARSKEARRSPSRLRADALKAGAALAHRMGDTRRAKLYAKESIDLYRELGDLGGEASALTTLGGVALVEGDGTRARGSSTSRRSRSRARSTTPSGSQARSGTSATCCSWRATTTARASCSRKG